MGPLLSPSLRHQLLLSLLIIRTWYLPFGINSAILPRAVSALSAAGLEQGSWITFPVWTRVWGSKTVNSTPVPNSKDCPSFNLPINWRAQLYFEWCWTSLQPSPKHPMGGRLLWFRQIHWSSIETQFGPFLQNYLMVGPSSMTVKGMFSLWSKVFTSKVLCTDLFFEFCFASLQE